ncbi:MAG: AraC family transcriptional regulator [Moritella sp.]|uniref:AraC family transcriptional regulator n=1 Tax=Moritella sp. TaxID=78556 RepID=UPI0029AF64C9|nr:AraC family transcriptional regulator [Moritella sp.]MDX2320521.1 AraC family transcriptional regulator [Moritella sp.]
MLKVDEVLNVRLIPVLGPALLIEYLTERHTIPLSILLSESGLTPQDIMDTSTRIPASKFIKIIKYALRITKNNGLGILLGQSLGPNSFQIMGHAAISQANLRDSLRLIVLYYKTTAYLTEISLTEQGGAAVFRITPLVHLGEVESFIIDFVISGFIAELNNFNFPTSMLKLSLAKPKPDYGEDYFSLLTNSVRFNTEHNEVHFPKEWLDRAVVTEYEVDCDESLIDICNKNLVLAEQSINTVERIKDSLRQASGQMPNLEDVAESYHQSTRSLQRALKVEGYSFRQLIEDIRKERSQHLLLKTQMTIVEIALELGYNDPPNFTRAFKQWFGCCPRHYRNQ